MTKKIFGTAIALIATGSSVFAQDSTKAVTLSGSVDAYYRYNFAGSGGVENNYNNFTSFTNSQSSFELGMASLRVDATALSGKVTAVADLGFGRRAQEFSYNDGDGWPTGSGNDFGSLAAIKQAFVTYSPTSKLKLTAGKFGTHIGYELLDAPLNRNYSMSYMFTNGPFFNTGLKADLALGKIGVMLGITNYTDQSTSTTNVNSMIAQISGGTSNGKIKAFLNYTGFSGSKHGFNPSGLEGLNQFDLVVTGVVSDKFNIGFNGTVQSRNTIEGSTTKDGSWFGLAGYFNWDPCASTGLTLRSEYIGDNDMVYYGTKSIWANTLSLNYKVGPLTIIPELRYETAGEEIYVDKDALGTKSTFTALVAAVYKF